MWGRTNCEKCGLIFEDIRTYVLHVRESTECPLKWEIGGTDDFMSALVELWLDDNDGRPENQCHSPAYSDITVENNDQSPKGQPIQVRITFRASFGRSRTMLSPKKSSSG